MMGNYALMKINKPFHISAFIHIAIYRNLSLKSKSLMSF